jgi:hypothetical protein
MSKRWKASVAAFHIEKEGIPGTWDDILSRPGDQSPVESLYSLKEQSARCGLSDCQQVHNRGFLVITADVSTRFMQSVRWQGDTVIIKRKQGNQHMCSRGL